VHEKSLHEKGKNSAWPHKEKILTTGGAIEILALLCKLFPDTL
jgi:hypothetical protein